MSEAIEKYGSPIAQKISKDGKNYAELVFDLDNGQRIACVSLTENSLIDAYVHFVFIIDGSSSVVSLPEITE